MPDIAAYASAFARNFENKVEEWSQTLAQLSDEGKKVVVWGAGSKAVTFLNILKTRDLVQFVVDINPRKASLFVPGTGQQIIEPSSLAGYKPDTVIIMNPIYRDEIAKMLKDLGVQADILVA